MEILTAIIGCSISKHLLGCHSFSCASSGHLYSGQTQHRKVGDGGDVQSNSWVLEWSIGPGHVHGSVDTQRSPTLYLSRVASCIYLWLSLGSLLAELCLLNDYNENFKYMCYNVQCSRSHLRQLVWKTQKSADVIGVQFNRFHLHYQKHFSKFLTVYGSTAIKVWLLLLAATAILICEGWPDLGNKTFSLWNISVI